jgi:nucleoside-diphosphate-sugar epimerase
VEVARADIRDADALTTAFRDADVVFHLAAHTHDLKSTDDSPQQHAITLGGTIAALRAAEACDVSHFIFASSLAVFGDVGIEAVSEGHPCRPHTPYGQAKLEAEEAVRSFAKRTGRFAASIRPAMIYGAGCPGNLPRMIRAIMARRFPPIPEFGNRRSMVFVDDVVAALVRAWRSDVRNGREFIITDGQAYSTRQLYDAVQTALGRPTSRMTVPAWLFGAGARVGDMLGALAGRRMPFDSGALERLSGSAFFTSSRAREELRFVPSRTLADALPAMIQHLSAP